MPLETFAEKDLRFLAYGTGWAREANLLNATVDLSTISDAEISAERAKQARWREAKFVEWIYLKTIEILNWAMGLSPGLIFTPIPTLDEIAAKAKTLTPPTLRGNIEYEDVATEQIQDAIKFMRKEFEPDKDPDTFRLEKWRKDEGFTIGSKMSTQSFHVEFTIEAFTALQKEIQEKVAVLVEAVSWHEKLKEIYKAELSQRGKDEPAELKRITSELRRVVKAAELQSGEMMKAVKKCCTSKFTDVGAAQSFSKAKRRFQEFRGEHHELLKQLGVVNVSGRKLSDMRDFPAEPTPRMIDERNDWQRIERLANLS